MTTSIVFDFDGVLVESVDVKTRAFAALYEPYGGKVVEQVVAYHLAHGGVSRYEKLRYFHSSILRKPLEKDEEDLLAQKFSEFVEDAVVAARYVPGAQEFLEKYYKGIMLFLSSGTPEIEMQRIVERRGMSHYFKSVYGSPKTKSEIIVRIIAENNLLPQEVLVVGDAMTDYEAARRNGLRFVGRTVGGSRLFPPNTTVVSDLQRLELFL